MTPESEGVDRLELGDEHGERWEATAHSNPDQPEGDVGATVRRFVGGELVDSYEFSFDRGRDRAGTVYRALPFVAPAHRLRASDVNRAKYEAGTAVADETGARVSVGALFSQGYLDTLPEGEEERDGASGSPPEAAERYGRLGLTDDEWDRLRRALRSVTEALETRGRDQNTLEELDDGQLTRIADALDAALAVLDEAAERDEEQPPAGG